MMRLCKGELYFESGLGEHVDQSIDTEKVHLALHQVADPGLTDAEQLCGFGLFESSIMNNPAQLNHQVRPDPKMRGLRCGEAEVLEHVSTRSRDFGGHGFLSASWCCVVSLPVLAWSAPTQSRLWVSSLFASQTHEARRRPPSAWRRRTPGARVACEFAAHKHQGQWSTSVSSRSGQAHPVSGVIGSRPSAERQPGSYECRQATSQPRTGVWSAP